MEIKVTIIDANKNKTEEFSTFNDAANFFDKFRENVAPVEEVVEELASVSSTEEDVVVDHLVTEEDVEANDGALEEAGIGEGDTVGLPIVEEITEDETDGDEKKLRQ